MRNDYLVGIERTECSECRQAIEENAISMNNEICLIYENDS